MSDVPTPPPRPTTDEEKQAHQMGQAVESYYQYLTQQGVKPDVAAAISSRNQQEEWQTQPSAYEMPLGEPGQTPQGYVAPDAGARNEWGAFNSRTAIPKPYNSLPVDTISLTTGDPHLQAKALRTLTGNPDAPPEAAKPGELLPADSGYTPKFIQDYNHFMQQYEQRRDENPEFWDYGLNWWGQVKSTIDQQRDNEDTTRRGKAIELMRPKPDFQE